MAKELPDPHIEYHVRAQKACPSIGPNCTDDVGGDVHTKADAEALVAFYESQGYSVKLSRETVVTLREDEIPDPPKEPA